jgi:hypothetical protein
MCDLKNFLTLADARYERGKEGEMEEGEERGGEVMGGYSNIRFFTVSIASSQQCLRDKHGAFHYANSTAETENSKLKVRKIKLWAHVEELTLDSDPSLLPNNYDCRQRRHFRRQVTK